MQDATGGALTIAAAGDAMVTKRLSRIANDRFRDLRTILTDADAAIVNLESPLHDFEPFPIARRRTHFRSPPWVADELAWLGFNLFAATNNHIGDYAQPGMTRTIDELATRNLAYAGIGRTRAHARSPTYVDTPNGRVALIAATTTFVPGTEAGQRRPDVRGRPGIATLRLRPRYVVTEDHLAVLQEISESLAVDDLLADRGEYVTEPPSEPSEELVSLLCVDAGTAGRTLFFEGTPNAEDTGIAYDAHPDDVAAIHEEITTARQNADAVVVSLHSHEGRDARYNVATVPRAIETFARECIDTGADLFCCHGAHQVRGIEVYQGAPIFYGLGNFVLQFNTVPYFPAEAYESRGLHWSGSPRTIQERIGNPVASDTGKHSVVPVCRFDGEELDVIRLFPIELGHDRDAATMGTAFLAPPQTATHVLDQLSALSEPYGTTIRTEDDIGMISG